MAGTLHDATLVRRTIAPAVRTNGTHNGAAVDRNAGRGAADAMVAVITGTITDGSHAVAVEDSADGSTDWQPVPAGQLQGTVPTVVAANDDTQFEVGVVQSRRFLRVSIVTTAATTGGLIAAVVVLGDFREIPVSHA